MDDVVTSLKLIMALLLVGASYLFLLPYFLKPEEFFIKRLRSDANQGITHTQLLCRAFVGIGFISGGLNSLALCLVFSIALHSIDTVWAWAWVWLTITMGGGTLMGAGHYIYFRFLRYKRLTPNERQATGDRNSGVFVWRTMG